jgi:hypothetical protein
MRSIATRTDMSFKPPSGFYQPSARKAKRESVARLQAGSSAISARIGAMSQSWLALTKQTHSVTIT